MQPFSYERAKDLKTAMAASRGGAAVIAGGTDLLDLMKLAITAPTGLVDINDLPLGAIKVRRDGVTIGALAHLSDVASHPAIRRGFPVLSQALLDSASGQIRNMATVGGNLMQRTRCLYFRDGVSPCAKRDPSTPCSAINGLSRGSAILGGSGKCIAVHPSDMAVALAALGAQVVIASPAGERRVPVEDFHVLPGDTPQIETVLKPGELVAAVEVPKTPGARRSVYLKVRDRASFEFALVSVAVALDLKGNVMRSARIVLGGVAPRPWRVPAAERLLAGKAATPTAFQAAAASIVRGATTTPLNEFKVAMAKNAVGRALALAAALR